MPSMVTEHHAGLRRIESIFVTPDHCLRCQQPTSGDVCPVCSVEIGIIEGRLRLTIADYDRWRAEALDEWEVDSQTSDYFVFAWIGRPFLEQALGSDDTEALRSAFATLEEISAFGNAAARNELYVVLEEDMETHRFYRFMGPTLRAHWLEAVTWLTGESRVDRARYVRRWAEEIERGGGWEELSGLAQKRIREGLWSEFWGPASREPGPAGDD